MNFIERQKSIFVYIWNSWVHICLEPRTFYLLIHSRAWGTSSPHKLQKTNPYKLEWTNKFIGIIKIKMQMNEDDSTITIMVNRSRQSNLKWLTMNVLSPCVLNIVLCTHKSSTLSAEACIQFRVFLHRILKFKSKNETGYKYVRRYISESVIDRKLLLAVEANYLFQIIMLNAQHSSHKVQWFHLFFFRIVSPYSMIRFHLNSKFQI